MLMSRIILRLMAAFLPIILIAACTGAQPFGMDKVSVTAYENQIQSGITRRTEQPTPAELELRLMSYADRYLSKAAQAADLYQRQVPTPAARDLGLATFVFPGLTVISIAAGGDPGSDLLDMVVFSTLQRNALEKGWAHEVLGEYAEPLILTQRQLEAQIWDIARDVLSTEQLTHLHEAIRHWQANNPNQRYVSNVKFDDVAASRGVGQDAKTLMEESDGFLAPLDAAVREGEEIRLTAKRSMYILQRMPPLLLAQTRYIIHEEVSPEQVQKLLQDISGFRMTADAAQKALAQLPEVIDKERAALVKDVDKLSPLISQGDGLARNVLAVFEALQEVERQYPVAGAVINETLQQYRAMAEVLDRSPPSDMGPKITLLREIRRIGKELNQLARMIHRENPETLRALFADVLNAVLVRAMVFALFVFGLAIAYRRLAR